MSIHALIALDQRDEKLREVIRQLTNQRDEARREVCNLMYQKGFPTGDYARERGWDCFKSDKQ
jgi:hypothetical protein